ncbi:hypothetical protein [Dyella psychrodurans]|uniref:Uncharacterized protein n=1 Tax=Dyella psychrodurans TaxID=1927960 RepID=A0A370WY30_9GAMM|nr:hypothetical protein [Dyella psychrodurans]RDS80960.1 hypothetical protein DWU99_18065 [Dyella psychrodurans]
MERIYNVFLFFENDICSIVSYFAHDHVGSDSDGVAMLKTSVNRDLLNAVKVTLKTPFTRDEFHAKCRLGIGHHLYDEAFAALGASASPLFVTTPVVNGTLFFNHPIEHGDIDIYDLAPKEGKNRQMVDWLVKYATPKGIELSQLIHDDYFQSIKLTFNAGLYVSAMKLLVSCIDSIAYIEYGNEKKFTPFTKWLDTYADLLPLGITSAELWELRNGILHMTNINSSKVRDNKIRRISFRVGGPPDYPRESDGVYYFDFLDLIRAFADAQARWLASYNANTEKFAKFVERYDETISDSRISLTRL